MSEDNTQYGKTVTPPLNAKFPNKKYPEIRLNLMTKEAFWNPLLEETGGGLQLFLDWIDKYKASVGWDKLFLPGIKYHHLPDDMQLAILETYLNLECGLCNDFERSSWPKSVKDIHDMIMEEEEFMRLCDYCEERLKTGEGTKNQYDSIICDKCLKKSQAEREKECVPLLSRLPAIAEMDQNELECYIEDLRDNIVPELIDMGGRNLNLLHALTLAADQYKQMTGEEFPNLPNPA